MVDLKLDGKALALENDQLLWRSESWWLLLSDKVINCWIML